MSNILEKGFAGFVRRLKDMNGYYAETVVDGGGQAGVVVETGTSAVTGSFSSITILADAVFSAFTETDGSGDAMTGFTIPAGVTLFGKITAFTLTSGKVRAYV